MSARARTALFLAALAAALLVLSPHILYDFGGTDAAASGEALFIRQVAEDQQRGNENGGPPSLQESNSKSKSNGDVNNHGKQSDGDGSARWAARARFLGDAIDSDGLFELKGTDALAPLHRTDALSSIAATGQRLFVAQTITQIHHGVYKIEALAVDPSATSQRPQLLRFAFKTECRPAAKWHGQQGWGEVAAHRFAQMLQQHSVMRTMDTSTQRGGIPKGGGVAAAPSLGGGAHIDAFEAAFDLNADVSASVSGGDGLRGPFANTVGFAAGGIVFITSEQLRTVVHRDLCGAMGEAELGAWPAAVDATDAVLQRAAEAARIENDEPPSLREYGLLPAPYANYKARFESQRAIAVSEAAASVPLYGVLLTWNPDHKDDAIPNKDYRRHFAAPRLLKIGEADSAAGSSGNGKISDAAARLHLAQVAEIMTLDYIMGNEDREDKNWFTGVSPIADIVDAQQKQKRRLIMMDNGWVFTGRAYKESICGSYEPLLLCPPLLRHLTGSGKCKIGGGAANAKLLQAAPAAAAAAPQKGDGAGGSSTALPSEALRATSTFMRDFLAAAPFPMCRFPRTLVEDLLRFGAAWVGTRDGGDGDGAGGSAREDVYSTTSLLAVAEAEILPLRLRNSTARESFKVFVEAMGTRAFAAIAANHDVSDSGGKKGSTSTSDKSLAAVWSRLVRNDLLISHLQHAHSGGSTSVFDFPLARHTGPQCGAAHRSNGIGDGPPNPIDLIASSMGVRIARTLRAVVDCVEAFGEGYVLLE